MTRHRLGGPARALLGAVVGLLVFEATVRVAWHAYGQLHPLGPGVGQTAFVPLTLDCDLDGTWYRHDPLLGWVAPTQRAVDGRPAAEAKPVVLLGDSYTWGEEVEPEDTFASVLQRARPDLAVVNLGVPGYGPEQLLLRWRTDGRARDPSHVVVAWVSQDAERAGRPVTYAPRPHARWDGGQAVLAEGPVPSIGEACRAQWWSPWSVALPRRWLVGPAEPADVDGLSASLLRTLRDEVEATGATFTLVWLPHTHEVVPGAPGPASLDGLSYVDLRPALAELIASGVVLEPHSHYLAPGHAVVGEALAEALETRDPS